MNKKYKTLLVNMALFFLASFIPKTISFFMVPLYTYCLTTTDYGTADLLTNTVQLLVPILTLQIQDSVLRYSMDEDYSPDSVFSIGIRITLRGGICFFVGVVFMQVLGIYPMEKVLWIYMIVNFLSTSLNSVCSYFCRAIGRIKTITISSISLSIVTIVLNIVFLVHLNMGLYGYLLANSIGAVVGVVVLFFGAQLHKYISFGRVDSELKQKMVLFSIPMIFSALSWWINNASDRYILTFSTGVSAVGLYAVSSKIPTILSTLSSVISRAYSISAIQELDYDDKDGFLGKSYAVISICATMACSVLIFLNVEISRVLFSKSFFEAWKFVPPLLIAALMNQLSLSCENLFIAIKNTKIVSATAIAAAAVNTILNFALIPAIGIYGAALATVLAFSFQWILRYYFLKRKVKLKDNTVKEVMSYLTLYLQMVIAFFGNRYIIAQMACVIFLIVLYAKEICDIVKGIFQAKKGK